MVKENPQIIFQDDFLLVLDKPAGMTVNRAETTQKEVTVQDWLDSNFNFPLAHDLNCRNGVVHRLDKETSGLLLVGKTQDAFEDLQRQFKEREVRKEYLALVHGRLVPKQGRIEASIARNPFDRKKFGIFLGGRTAKTFYEVEDYFKDFSLVKLKPETGRTHQIRVHLKFIGHPIVGDEKYAGRKTARKDRKWCPRHFLHASTITFAHPITKKTVNFSSKLPSDLQLAMMKI